MASPQTSLASNDRSPARAILQQPPLLRRLFNYMILWALKIALYTHASITHYRSVEHRASAPTLIKCYPSRPKLRNRIFFPKSYKSGTQLPLLLDIYGSGFSILSPYLDDQHCFSMANHCDILVVSIDHSKSPSVKHPTAVHDIASIARDIIDDPNLPIDKARVAISGFSAGGNLALAASLLPELKGLVKAAIAVYPIVDGSLDTASRLASLPAGPLKSQTKFLKYALPFFKFGYLKSGQDLREPLLSPAFAAKKDLPPWIYCIAAEFDMLCGEARDMMMRIMEKDNPTEDEKFALEMGKYKWEVLKGVDHGFNYHLLGGMISGEKIMNAYQTEKLRLSIGEWLFRGPFAS